jgi:hypothetical protein
VQHGKFALTAAMFALGLRGRLLARRYAPLDGEQRAAYAREIETVRSVQLKLKSASGCPAPGVTAGWSDR